MEKHSILVVDDNREILTTIGALLEAQGYDVDFAFDGEEALEKIATGVPDLILTDIFMPGMGGLELAEALRRDPRLEKIPILAMSAIGEYETGEPRKDLLADDFIGKPPAKQELLDKVEALLRRGQAPLRGGMSAFPAPAARPAPARRLPPVSERMYRLIAENSFDWQLWMAPGDRVLYCSASSLQITGYSPEQFTADPKLWTSIVHPLDRSLWRDHRAAARAGAPSEELQFRIVAKDGRTKWIGHVCGPIHDEAGRFLGTLSSNRDISDRKALEARLLRGQRLETVGALTEGIVHDANNILTPILLGIEVLRGRLPDEASRRVFESMESSARRGADLLHQMLSLTRGGGQERAEVQVQPLVSRIETIVRETFPRAIRFSARVPDDIWSISAHSVELTQVLMNLCLLSREAMPQGGALEITAENVVLPERQPAVAPGPAPGRHVLFSVRSGGTASLEEAPLLRSGVPGAVDKLPVARGCSFAAILDIVQHNGGSLDVASGREGETTFRLHLPAAPLRASAKAAETSAPPAPGNGELLLLVDDEGVIREATRAVLEGHGYRVVCAGGGPEALAIYAARWQEISLVLTDLMMPVMDGRSTLQALKRINPQAKVIAMSGLAQAHGRAKERDREFAGFLPKPFSAASLLGLISGVLNRRDS